MKQIDATQKERKEAFRKAYEFLERHTEVENTYEYFLGLQRDCADETNLLFHYLAYGIMRYLEDQAKKYSGDLK